MTPIRLLTHNGAAHADEVFAIAALKFIHPNAEIIRTRDPAMIREAKEASDFLLDIGLEYDASRNRFDHHQSQGAGFRDTELNQWPYATAGLVWKHFGVQTVLALKPFITVEEASEVADFIDLAIIKYIDAVDCGVRLRTAGPSLSALIASFNGAYSDEDAFNTMLALAQGVLSNYISRQVDRIKAREAVRSGSILANGHLLVLDNCLPWAEVVMTEMPDVLLVAYPVGEENKGRWQLRTAMNRDRSNRMTLPEVWGGLEGKELIEATGVESAVFAHRAGHLAAAVEYDCIINLAQKALINPENLNIAPEYELEMDAA